MKSFCSLILAVFSLVASAAADKPQLVSTGLEKAYIPLGFDDNDVPQIYVKGRLKDTCDQVGPVSAEVDRVNERVTITQQAYRYRGPECWPVSTPYEHVVNLPVIEKQGDYSVIDGATGVVLGILNIKEAPPRTGPGSDDHIYAPIQDFQLKQEQALRLKLVLIGSFPNSCMVFRTIEVIYQKDVVVVMPIVEMLKPKDQPCTNGSFPFYEVKPLTQLLGQYPHLFHVRSMKGQAVNRLLDPYGPALGPGKP